MAETVFSVLKKQINEEVNGHSDFIAGGSCKDFSDYKLVVGKIRGLNSALQNIMDLEKNYTDDE